MHIIKMDKEWQQKLEREIDSDLRQDEKLAKAKVAEVLPLIARLEPHVFGFVLADLVAIWVSAFRDGDDLRGDAGNVDEVRQHMLFGLMKTAVMLVKDHDAQFRAKGMMQ